MPAGDFYIDFARVNFGETVAEAAGNLSARTLRNGRRRRIEASSLNQTVVVV
jgi:hypothetical protein